MPRMTEEEASALDEFVTANPPRVNPAKARHAVRAAADVSADYSMVAPQSNEQLGRQRLPPLPLVSERR